MSLPEVTLRRRLRRRAGGVKVRRQHPLGPYVLDFYCPSVRLAVEIDGDMPHASRVERDEVRAAFIQAAGLRLHRLSAKEVPHDPEAAADAILRAALPLQQPPAGPPPHAPHGEDQE